jgi:DNA-binding NarL/FixJ family response regulator
MACLGHTDKEIAHILGITCPTVRTYIARLMVKMGATNRTQLGVLTAEQNQRALYGS